MCVSAVYFRHLRGTSTVRVLFVMSCSILSWLDTSASSQWSGAGRDASEYAWISTAAHIVSTSVQEGET